MENTGKPVLISAHYQAMWGIPRIIQKQDFRKKKMISTLNNNNNYYYFGSSGVGRYHGKPLDANHSSVTLY